MFRNVESKDPQIFLESVLQETDVLLVTESVP
jgi:hypothetical protein